MKYKFSRIEKYIIWETHEQKCFWCGVPLSLKTQSIDHIIPESMQDKIEQIKIDYDLPGNFVINGFCNWVPAHNNCNSKKGFELFTPSPVFLAILNDVVKNSIPAQKSYTKLKNQTDIEVALEKLLILVEEEKTTEEKIIQSLGYQLFKDEQIKELGLEIPSNWKVENVDLVKNIVTVSNGGQYGRTIIPPKDGYNPWWFCKHCGYYGPWSGSMCLSCGHFNDPND